MSNKNYTFSLRVSPERFEKLRREAEQKEISINSLITLKLNGGFNQS